MDYKIYVLDATGHISAPPQVIDCADAQEAIRRRIICRWDGGGSLAGQEFDREIAAQEVDGWP